MPVTTLEHGDEIFVMIFASCIPRKKAVCFFRRNALSFFSLFWRGTVVRKIKFRSQCVVLFSLLFSSFLC